MEEESFEGKLGTVHQSLHNANITDGEQQSRLDEVPEVPVIPEEMVEEVAVEVPVGPDPKLQEPKQQVSMDVPNEESVPLIVPSQQLPPMEEFVPAAEDVTNNKRRRNLSQSSQETIT